jgi:PAS domain-containing protein
LLEQVAQAGSWHWHATGADGLGPFSWTPALAQLLQWPQTSAPPWRSPWDLLAPKRRAAVQTLLQGAHQGSADPGEVIELESMALNGQGQEQPIRLLMRCQPDSGRAVWHGVVQDRSEHHQRLAQAQHERMQLSTTLASMTEAFATLDREGRFTYVNAETCSLLERSSAQLLGKRLWRELDDQGSGNGGSAGAADDGDGGKGGGRRWRQNQRRKRLRAAAAAAPAAPT